ncbi:MAG TPA: hypothetical protein VHX86_17525, partial [Tepidisphaeraceae bacterium]|nr:hypothetical protein [Tepidisphaeraceae bacterium]
MATTFSAGRELWMSQFAPKYASFWPLKMKHLLQSSDGKPWGMKNARCVERRKTITLVLPTIRWRSKPGSIPGGRMERHGTKRFTFRAVSAGGVQAGERAGLQ